MVQLDVIVIIAGIIIRVTVYHEEIEPSAEPHPWKAVTLFGSCLDLSVSGSFQEDCKG